MKDQNWHQLWVNMHLATMNGDDENPLGIILQGALATDHAGNIAFVGAREDLPEDLSTIADFTYDMDGGWMLPGFIDCQTAMVHGGSRADMFIANSQGQEIETKDGILKTVADTAAATPDQLLEKARQRLLTQLQTGVTCFNITARYGFHLKNIQKILSIATELRDEYDIILKRSYEILPILPETYPDLESYVSEICTVILPNLKEEALVDTLTLLDDGFLTEAQADQIKEAAAQLQIPLSNATTDILCPTLGKTDQKPSTTSEKAIATGYNPETHPNLSISSAMHMACQQHNISVEEALKGTTIHAAKALGVENIAGSLEIGKEAHFALYAIESPADLVYYMGTRPCQAIALKGQYISFV